VKAGSANRFEQTFFARQADEAFYGRDAFQTVHPPNTKIFMGRAYVSQRLRILPHKSQLG
jgi:hypothetical protein